MKSKKNKINLGTKTRKFYDSFVSFLFNRFNKPKKIIQKGGATADDIKLDFLRALYNKIPRNTLNSSHTLTVKNSIITAANELLNEDPYKTPLNDYKFQYNFTDKTNNILKWFKDGLQDPPPVSYPVLFVTKSDETRLNDAELVRLFNLSAPAAPSAAEFSVASPPANPVLEEQQFYMNFRNEIKQIMGGKPCNDETIGEAGKQLMATDKYKNLAKQYEFNESYILQDDKGDFNGDFLRWFCGNSADPPQGGFPKMFIPLRSNAKGILDAYKDEPNPEDVTGLESKAKVGNGVLGYGPAVDGAAVLGTLGAVGLAAANYGGPIASGLKSRFTSKKNSDQDGNSTSTGSSDGSGQGGISTDTGSSDGSGQGGISINGESSDGSGQGGISTNGESSDGSAAKQEELGKEVAQEMEQERMEQERLEEAFKNPPEGWTVAPPDKNGIYFLSRKGNSESSRPEEAWMRKIENSHPVWTKTVEKGHAIRNPTVKPTVKPTIEQSNNKTANSLLLLPPPPPPHPLVQLPGTNDSFSGQLGVADLGNNTAPSYHPNSSSIGGPTAYQPQVAPRLRGFQPGVGLDTTSYGQVGTAAIAGLLGLYLSRKLLTRGANKTSSKKKSAIPEAAIMPKQKVETAATTTPEQKTAAVAPTPTPIASIKPTLEQQNAATLIQRKFKAKQAVEAEQKRQLEAAEQKRQEQEDKLKQELDTFKRVDYKCRTIVNQANIFLRSREKEYEKDPETYSKLKNSIIAYIASTCPGIDTSVLQKFSSEIGEAPERVSLEQSSSTAPPSYLTMPGRVTPPGRLIPIHPEVSHINSNNSEDEISSGFSWKQGNP